MKLVTIIKTCLNETYSKCGIGKSLSDAFPIRDGVKQGDILPLLFFNLASQHAIRKDQENERQELNGTHKRLVSADDVDILGENILV
jgi:hypothetical protein